VEKGEKEMTVEKKEKQTDSVVDMNVTELCEHIVTLENDLMAARVQLYHKIQDRRIKNIVMEEIRNDLRFKGSHAVLKFIPAETKS
jgi:phosphoenolpyruvate-protein kinase (PTS system EI component)